MLGTTNIKNNKKTLSLHLVGCLYYLYQWCTFSQISNRQWTI